MLCPVSTHDQGEIDSKNLTLFSVIIVELWTRQRVMGNEDENEVEATSREEKSRVQLRYFGWDDLGLVV
jgi:hypothetical protein